MDISQHEPIKKINDVPNSTGHIPLQAAYQLG